MKRHNFLPIQSSGLLVKLLKKGLELEKLKVHGVSGTELPDYLELERVPDPARRPGPDEKLAENEPKFLYYPGPNLGQARKIYGRLDRTRKNARYTRIE